MPFELAHGSGAYRWYYVDATQGDRTAVAIFMIGSIFSARYAAAQRHGAEPHQHAAVNFALYERGVRKLWVLSEYPAAALEDGGRTLRIGGSTLRSTGPQGLAVQIAERTAPWGQPVRAALELEALGAGGGPLSLVEGLGHVWHPIAPRAHARVSLPELGVAFEGQGYHDGNHGPVPLGSDLRGWEWARTHELERTVITYRPWHPSLDGPRPAISLHASQRGVNVFRETANPEPRWSSGWGLSIPRALGPTLLESSPFYARLEVRRIGAHVLSEVADFQRFHSPWFRWMAHLRTRVVRGGARAP